MEAQQIICPNCSKQIAQTNFALHESHCRRNLSKCGICGEFISQQQRIEHEALHANVMCENCGEEMQFSKLARHRDEQCVMRQVCCQYCELGIPFQQMQEHEDYCGNRTDLCQLCHKYVRLKEFGVHIETNCAYPETPVKSSPSINESRVDMLRASILASCIGGGDSAARIYQEYTRIMATPTVRQEISAEMLSGDVSELPCEVCGKLVMIEELLDHQLMCEEDNVFDEDVEREYEMIEMELHSLQQPKKITSAKKKKMKRRDSVGKQTKTPQMASEVDQVSRSRKKCQPPPNKVTPTKVVVAPAPVIPLNLSGGANSDDN